MENDFIEGDEWDAYVTLDTFSTNGTRDGLRARAPGSRSLRSSPRWGEPTTWRRETGGRHLKGQGCEMHNNLNRVDVVHWRAA